MYNMCNQCEGFFSALDDVFANDPSLRRASSGRFGSNMRAVREFIIETHAIPPDEKVQWIKTVLENEESHLRSHSSETEQGIADNSEALQVIIADCLASQLTFTQDCHIAMYNQSMAHSDSARHLPSSLVPPARSNPLRFVKSAT